MQSELKRSKQYFRSVGLVHELGLKQEECDIKVRDKDGNDAGTKKGERILGNVVLKTDNGLHTFNVYFQNLDFRGEPSKNWKMAQAMMNWNPSVNGTGEPATLVALEGTVSVNDYVNPSTGILYTNLRWRVSKATTKVDENEHHGTGLKATCYVAKIAPEIRNEEETGRLVVTLMAGNNDGTCFPIECIVTEDLADDFNDVIEVGTTVPFDFDRTTRHVGETKGGRKVLGRASQTNVNTGYDIDELILAGADEPVEKPEELEDEDGNPIEDKSGWIDPVAMKKAIKVRNQMLEEMKKNPNPAKRPAGFKEQKANMEKKAKKSVGKVREDFDGEDDDNESPF